MGVIAGGDAMERVWARVLEISGNDDVEVGVDLLGFFDVVVDCLLEGLGLCGGCFWGLMFASALMSICADDEDRRAVA